MNGEINVQNVIREAQERLERWERLRQMQERLEEREALYWLHRAESEAERENVKVLYGHALERWSKRKAAQN